VQEISTLHTNKARVIVRTWADILQVILLFFFKVNFYSKKSGEMDRVGECGGKLPLHFFPKMHGLDWPGNTLGPVLHQKQQSQFRIKEDQ
jgi:hypothetical protein